MNYLLDTHIVIWLAREPQKLSSHVIDVLENQANTLYFSSINLWKIALKSGLNKPNFKFDVIRLEQQLLAHGFVELPVTSKYAKLIEQLPLIHKDPFDRMLIAQAMTENYCLITDDDKIAQYPQVALLLN